MGAPQGGYGGGGGYGGQQSPYGGGGYGTSNSGPGGLANWSTGTLQPQQPAYGMGTGGQYSPQLRQAQTAWQNQYTGAQQPYGGGGGGTQFGGYGDVGNVWKGQMPPMSYEEWSGLQQTGDTTPETYAKYADPLNARNAALKAQETQQPPMFGGGNPWQQPMRQPYGMGAQGNGNAYGYGGQQGNPWAGNLMQTATQGSQITGSVPTAPQNYYGGQQGNPWAQMLAMMQQPQQGSTSLSPVSAPQAPLQAPTPPPPAAPPPMPTSFSGLNNLPKGAYQIPGYNAGPAAAPPPPAAPARAQYSPNNPYGGLYSNPQADAWEQQQRGGSPTPAPTPAAPGTDVMRKALAASPGLNQGTNPGYGYGTPGGYQLDTAPSTLDPGSMNGLLGILGGSGYPSSAANYANWYQQQYGTQAPGGPRAYPF